MNLEKKFRWLKQVCMLSLLLNLVFVCLFYIVAFSKGVYRCKSSSLPLVAKRQPIKMFSEDFLAFLSNLSFTETMALLDEDQLFYGYPLKLWALGRAIHVYHVDISPALPHTLKFIELNDKERVWQLPKLSDSEYQAVRKFLSVEKFPFSSLGLFLLLTHGYEQGFIDEGCFYAFCNTPEFLYLRILLAGADSTVASIELLVQMVIRGGHGLFFSLCNEETRVNNISDMHRRELLLQYLKKEESLAAQMLLVHDSEWILHELDDQTFKYFLSKLPLQSEEAQHFIARIAHSPRACLLGDRSSETHEILIQNEEKSAERKEQYLEYCVEKGDSLWLLARRFHVSIQEIKELNQLSHDGLRLGQKLKIPERDS